MTPFSDAPRMLTPDALDRRSMVKGVSLGAGAVVLQPFLESLAAEGRGAAAPDRVRHREQRPLGAPHPAGNARQGEHVEQHRGDGHRRAAGGA